MGSGGVGCGVWGSGVWGVGKWGVGKWGVGCGVWGSGEVGCGVWGVGCGEVGKWGSCLITLSPQNPITLSPAFCLLHECLLPPDICDKLKKTRL